MCEHAGTCTWMAASTRCCPICRLCIELILLFCPRYYKGKGVLLEVCNQVRGNMLSATCAHAGWYHC